MTLNSAWMWSTGILKGACGRAVQPVQLRMPVYVFDFSTLGLVLCLCGLQCLSSLQPAMVGERLIVLYKTNRTLINDMFHYF